MTPVPVPYFVLGQPRSRLAWMANALTHGASYCMFEGSLGCVSIDDLAARLTRTASPRPGNSDCTNAMLLPRILERWPNARLVVVNRDTDAVAVSLARLGLEADPKRLQAIRRGLDLASRLDNTLVVPFQDLGIAEVGAALWEHLGLEGFDARRWRMLDELNVQVRHEVEVEKAREFGPAIVQLLGDTG